MSSTSGPSRVYVITDCGSTTTKALLIERVDGVYRQTYRGEAPTTVEAPVEDVTVGVAAAMRDLSAVSGREIIDENGEIIRPASGGRGVDMYLSTSSAGGGLQMAVMGMASGFSARSAQRAALGAGAIVADTIACDDDQDPLKRIERIRGVRPDMVLLAGGTDGGAEVGVVEMAEILAAAEPRPRFGDSYELPVIYAGNPAVKDEVARVLEGKAELFPVPNLLPTVDEEALGPARDKIHDLFLEHVMQQAPGFPRLLAWADAPVIPTPSAVGSILGLAARREGMNVLCVDIGGATTDVFSVMDGRFTRTVSANLGVSYSAAFVLAEAGLEGIMRWLPFEVDGERLRDTLMNKTVRPTTIPDSPQELQIEQALAREALRLSLIQHRLFAVPQAGAAGRRNIDGGFSTGAARESLVDMMRVDLIVGSGGVLSHAPRMDQTVAMIIDAFEPRGVTRVAKDSIFMMPHLGVLSGTDEAAAASVFERDCVVDLCTCVAPAGAFKHGRVCAELTLAPESGPPSSMTLRWGQVQSIELPAGQVASLEISPRNGADFGAGKGRRLSTKVRGGPCGVIFDCRGRPLVWPQAASTSSPVASWRAGFSSTGGGAS